MAVLIIILGVVIWYFISFNKEKNKQIEKLEVYGGFHRAYEELLSEFYEIPNVQVLNKTRTSITFLINDRFAVTHFYIMHSFNKINVTWELQSISYGEHKLNWTFPDYQLQSQMLKVIFSDMEAYNQRVYEKMM